MMDGLLPLKINLKNPSPKVKTLKMNPSKIYKTSWDQQVQFPKLVILMNLRITHQNVKTSFISKRNFKNQEMRKSVLTQILNKFLLPKQKMRKTVLTLLLNQTLQNQEMG